MRSIAVSFAVLLGLAVAQPLLAQNPPIKIAGLVELSGTGATSGTNFNDGAKLAVKEINAAGGILGRKIEYTSSDTQSQPPVCQGARDQKAIDDGAYVVMGPVFSGSIMVSMAETQARRDPQFHGRRGGGDHPAGQPVHLPHLVHAVHGDAQGRPLSQGHPQGEIGRHHLDQQRLRQGRSRRRYQGPRALRHQGRRRHLHRPGPARFLRPRAQGQAGERRRAVRLHQRGGVGARAARAAQAGLRQADRRRDDAYQPEGDRARGRRRQRRGRARGPHRGCAASGIKAFASQIPEGIQATSPITTA